MILWIVLFVLVVAISFVLALASMRDFIEAPQKEKEYSVFLIRKIGGLNVEFLNSISRDLSKSGLMISLERLFKGKKSALVIFGPRQYLLSYQHSLNLLELEDYTNVSVQNVAAWEIGIKKNGQWTMDDGQLFSNLPVLLESEQFWWQIILSVSKSKSFQGNLRAVLVSADQSRRRDLQHALQNLSPGLVKLPKAFSNTQLLDFYQKRSFSKSQKLGIQDKDILSLVL